MISLFDGDRISYPLCWLVGPQHLRWALLCDPTSRPQTVLNSTPTVRLYTSPGMGDPLKHVEMQRVHECRNHAKLET